MSNLEMLQSWVASLNQRNGIDLVFDENQVCTLSYGDNLCVSLAPSATDDESFVIAGPVCSLTMDPAIDDRLLKTALKLNFLGSETAFGTLSLSAHNGTLIFAHTLNYNSCDDILLHND